MAASTRHLHRQNLTAAVGQNDEFDDQPRSLGHGARRPSDASGDNAVRSASVPDAPSDETSDLDRFLLIGNGSPGHPSDGGRAGGMAGSMNTWGANAYLMALEPLEVRREKVIMLAEAYALFGGLFLGGTWILYEWGNPNTVNEGHHQSQYFNEVYARLFNAIMAGGICSNVFLALWSSALWIHAIVYSTRENFVIEAQKSLAYCHKMFNATISWVMAGVFQALYQTLAPNWPEFAIVSTMAGIMCLQGVYSMENLLLKVSPLTLYHMPRYMHTYSSWTRKGRELRERATKEADELKQKAYQGRPSMGSTVNSSDIGFLLRRATGMLGRSNFDTSLIETHLEEDWFDEAGQLKGAHVEFLSRYMPYRLAKQVHALIEAEYSENGVKMMQSCSAATFP